MSGPYDFQNLSFDDFERLCADLMQERLGLQLESFRTGRDGGIDLRHAPTKDRTTIIQCKRYAPDAFARLYSDLGAKELAKVKRLNPQRYVVCTSCRLNPDQKGKLLALLAPYCRSSADIYGASELNRLIAENEAIERRNFKLWLGSTAVLQRVLHAGIFAYSEHEVEVLQREISRYVVHQGFDRALQILDQTHHCIIVGLPGVGKTTAARLLLAHYLRDGYEVVSVSRDVEEAWKVLNRSNDAKQIVYYDDFLGQVTFSQKLEKNEDRRILELITHCKNSKNKRFVLTTRDYILDQAVGAHEPLDRARSNLKSSTVTLDDYSPVVRARLLANHLQFSNLGREILQAVVSERTYEKILKHPNFLPRIIEQICSDSEVEGRSPQEFISNAVEVLNDPARVWLRPFQQLSPDARLLAYALASLDGNSDTERLEQAWRALKAQLKVPNERAFTDVLRELEGSFTHSQKYPAVGRSAAREACLVRFVNPSVREFVMSDLVSEGDRLGAIFRSAVSFTQLLFWRESRLTVTSKPAAALAAVHADTIAAKAITLLSVGDAALTVLSGKQTILWSASARQISRLNNLFRAFAEMTRPDLTDRVGIALFGKDLDAFTKLLFGGDLTWAAQVLEPVLKALKSVDPEGVTASCNSLQIQEWPSLAHDFIDVRNIWETALRVLELTSSSPERYDQMRALLIGRTRRLCEELPSDLSAEEIGNAGDELDLVIMDLDLDLELDDEKASLKARAAKQRESEEDEDESSAITSNWFREDLAAPSDVDGIFKTLAEQLDRS